MTIKTVKNSSNEAQQALYYDIGRLFAPYGDIGSGFKPNAGLSYSLGFANVNCGTMAPVIAQGEPLSSITSLVNEIKAANGKVILSLGGALQSPTGTMPAVCAAKASKSAQDVAEIYQTFVDTYSLEFLDFDIEGLNVDNAESLKLRSQAIAILQKKNPFLSISLTLPVAKTGLIASGLAVLESAKTHGARIDIVNIMAMNYGGAISDMGNTAISASEGTLKQIASIGFPKSPRLGITPMSEVNDIQTEVFSLKDAQTLVDWASKTPEVGFLSFWSVNRDKKGDFTKILSTFSSSSSSSLPATYLPSTSPSTQEELPQDPIQPSSSSEPSQSSTSPSLQVKASQNQQLSSAVFISSSCSVSLSPIKCASPNSFAQCAPSDSGDGTWIVRECAGGTTCKTLPDLSSASCF
jgi:hypothetical protein